MNRAVGGWGEGVRSSFNPVWKVWWLGRVRLAEANSEQQDSGNSKL